MKSKKTKLYAEAVKQTVFTNKGVKGIHLSFEVKCEKGEFESYVRRSAELLECYDLENVKTFSIRFELIND